MDWKNSKILITGGAGFIGQAILKRILDYGADVTVLDDFSLGSYDRLSFFKGKIIEQKVHNKNISKIIDKDIDIIYHFAAPCSVIMFNENPEKRFRETISGFINIFDIAQKRNVKKVIFPSSSTVYGTVPPPQSEKDKPSPINLYGIAKYTCEMIAKYHSKYVTSVGLRIFAGYGPGEDHKKNIASPITLFLNSIIKNEPPVVFGNGSQRRDFVYIKDIVNACIKSVELETFNIVNVGSGNSYTFNNAITLINKILNKDITPTYVNKPINYIDITEADISLMQNKLGIIPMNLEEGLKDYIATLI